MKKVFNIIGFLFVAFLSAVLISATIGTPLLATSIATGTAGIALSYIPQETGLLNFALLGFTRSCGERSGGGNALYLAIKADVTSFTLAGKLYSGVTMSDAPLVFKKYEFEQDSMEIKYETTRENGSAKVVKTIEFDLGKMSQESRDAVEEIKVASNCGLIAIAEDNNGQKWVYGYTEKHKKERTLQLSSGNATSGKQLTDANNTVVTLVAQDTEEPRTFTGVVPV